MIFVTLGTQDKHFPRLLEAVEKLEVNEEIIAQVGSTKFKSDKIKIFDYLDSEDFEKYMNDARVIISHAGVGTILKGVQLGKKMIVAARMKKYGEHVNDHQKQILDNFSSEGYILPLYDFEKLSELLNVEFVPNKFVSNNMNFRKKLFEEINKEKYNESSKSIN